MKTNQAGRWGLVALAIGSIAYTSLASVRARRKSKSFLSKFVKPEFEVTRTNQAIFEQNPLVPAGWAFGVIWPLIYAGLTKLMVHQALDSQTYNLRYHRARPWWVAGWGLNALFGYFFAKDDTGSLIASDLTTKANLVTALGAYKALEIDKASVPFPENLLRIAASLYVGWLTTASIVGTPNTLLALDAWDSDDDRDIPLAAGIVGAAAGAGYGLARNLNDPWILPPFVVGFSGIAARQWDQEPLIGRTAAAMAGLYVGLLTYWLPKGTFRPYQKAVVNDAVWLDEFRESWKNRIKPYLSAQMLQGWRYLKKAAR